MRFAAVAVGACVAFVGLLPTAWAGVQDYEFRLSQSEFKQGDNVVISVALVDKRDGKPVPDAVIFAKRLDMEPEGMATMATALEAVPASEPGTYRFKTNLTMEGGWRLSLAAKIQGETGTLENRLALRVAP